jgi:hypothetical protein
LPFSTQASCTPAGAEVSRQTLATWVICASQGLQPLANLIGVVLLDSDTIHMHEAKVQDLKEPGRYPGKQSFMWVQRDDDFTERLR